MARVSPEVTQHGGPQRAAQARLDELDERLRRKWPFMFSTHRRRLAERLDAGRTRGVAVVLTADPLRPRVYLDRRAEVGTGERKLTAAQVLQALGVR